MLCVHVFLTYANGTCSRSCSVSYSSLSPILKKVHFEIILNLQNTVKIQIVQEHTCTHTSFFQNQLRGTYSMALHHWIRWGDFSKTVRLDNHSTRTNFKNVLLPTVPIPIWSALCTLAAPCEGYVLLQTYQPLARPSFYTVC